MTQKQILQELSDNDVLVGDISFTPIEKSAVNKCFKLDNNQQCYFLKVYEFTRLIPTDRQALFRMQKALAELHLAPNPLYLGEHHDFQLEQWIEHSSLNTVDTSLTDKIDRLAMALSKVHQTDVFAGDLDLPSDWKMYIDMAGINPDSALRLQIENATRLWLDTHKHDQALCHNDLAMDHVSAGDSLCIFDWEYAAFGNRYYDLASSAYINQFNHQQTNELASSYARHNELDSEMVQQKVAQQVPLVELTNSLWFLAAKVKQPQ